MIDHLPPTLAVVAVLIAAFTDLRYYRIHNLLTVPLFVSGLAFSLIASGWWGLAASVGGAVVGFATLVGLYLAGGMGAGDVKLMAGLGAWLGPAMIGDVLLASCIAAGVYAFGLLVSNRLWRRPYVGGTRQRWSLRRLLRPDDGERLAELAESPARRRRLIPFGLAILVGLLATLAGQHVHF